MAMFLSIPMAVFAFADLTFTTAPSPSQVSFLQITGITNPDTTTPAASYTYYLPVSLSGTGSLEEGVAPSYSGIPIPGFSANLSQPGTVGWYLVVLELDSGGLLLNYGSVQITNSMLLAPTPGATTITGGEEVVTVSNYATVAGCQLYLVPSSLYPSGGGAIDLANSIEVTGNGPITVPAGNYNLYTVYTSSITSPYHGSYVKGTEVTVTAAAGSGAPVLTSGSVGRTSNTTATVSFTSDSAGLYAWQLDGTAPAVTTLALSTPIAMVVGTNTISLTGLTPGPHTIYIVAQGANQIVSETLIIGIPGYTQGGSATGSPSTDVPQTGDSSNTQAWIIVLIGSLLGLCVLTVLRKRLKADDQR